MKYMALLILSSSMLVGAHAGECTSSPVRLTVELVDGSRVIGRPGISSVPVHTAYSKMDIDLVYIRRIDIEQDHENASIALHSGITSNG